MKKIFIFLALACVAYACGNDTITPIMTVESAFDIQDDPSDPVQSLRHQLFAEYNVSVLFRDTIAATQVGTDYWGDPIIRYETVDLNWTFDGYEQDIRYEFDYITEPEAQLAALEVARAYLEMCSPAMRPYSILLTDGMRSVSGSDKTERELFIGFRTLVLTRLDEVVGEEAVAEKARSVILSQVKNRVTGNKQLCNQFYLVSEQQGWYNQIWKLMDNCPTINANTAQATRGWNFVNLFHGAPYPLPAVGGGRDYVEHMQYVFRDQYTVEQLEATRAQMLREMGNFGFIATDRSAMTPSSKEMDLDLYLRAMLYLGSKDFEDRYCASPLVAEKYEMLRDYIENTLRVELTGQQ